MLLRVQNKPKIQLEEYLFFDDTLPSAHLEEFACKEVMGQKGLPPWGRGLKPNLQETDQDIEKRIL